MKFKGIKNIDVIALIENTTELFKLGKYKSRKFVEQYIGLGLSKVGFYGLIEGNDVKALKDNQTTFDSPTDLDILIEGVVELEKTPVNNGAGNIVYQGYGVLEVNGVVIYDGRIGTITATWGSINGTLSNQTDLQNELNDKLDSSEKGAANGVATLDAGSKLPVSQLPVSAMEYKGVWNADTNSPALVDSTGTNGDYYLVSVDGTTTLDGVTDWQIGDAVLFNGDLNVWQKVGKLSTGGDASIVSINGKKDSAGTIAKGLPVYLVGYDSDLHTVELADANNASAMPVIGFTGEPFNNTDSKPIITYGKLEGIDTTSTISQLNPNGETWAVNDALYISTNTGGLTKVRPTGSGSLIQRIAKVLKVDATGGQIFVFNTARTAGLPNLSADNIWVGDSNGIPQMVNKSTISPALNNGEVFVGNASNQATSVAMSGDVAITNTGVTTIQPDTVTYDKMQDTTQAALLGNETGAGTIAEIPIVEQYLTTGAITALLENTANWDINGVYTGSAITGTFQGQSHYDSNYYFTAVDDNVWIRLIRG
jgi:hypothetical protein